MAGFLLLPRDLNIFIDQLSPEEIDAVIPTEYEIEKLPIQTLATTLINNTLRYQPDYTKLSDGLCYNLQLWMYVITDQRLLDVVAHKTDVRSVIWHIHAHFIRAPNVTVPAPSELGFELNKEEPVEPIFVKTVETMENLIKAQGDFPYYFNFFLELMSDAHFLQHYPIEAFMITLSLAGPLTIRPLDTLPQVEKFTSYLQSIGLQHYVKRLGLLEGNILMNAGQFDKAIDKFIQVEEYADLHHFNFGNAAKNNRGIILFYTGRWDEALEIYFELLKINPHNPVFLNNIADAYTRKGDFQTAWEYAQKFMELAITPVVSMYEFIQHIVFELGLDEEAQKLMKRVRQIAETANFLPNIAALKLMEARQARYDINMGQAMTNISEAINMAISWKNLPFMYLLLVEQINIYIDFYEMRPTENNRQRLFNAIDTLIQLSDEQQIAMGSIQGLQMRSQVFLSFGQIQNAKEDMYNATKLAYQSAYTDLHEQLTEELNRIKAMDTVDDEQKHSIISRMKTKLRQLVGLGSTGRYQSIPVEIHGCILMSTGGLPVFTNYRTDKLKSDSTLISGVISAVTSVLNEATQSKGFLQTIVRDDFSLLFEPVHDFLTVAVVSKDSFEVRQRLKRFTDRIRVLLDKYDLNSVIKEIPNKFDNDMLLALEQTLIIN